MDSGENRKQKEDNGGEREMGREGRLRGGDGDGKEAQEAEKKRKKVE